MARMCVVCPNVAEYRCDYCTTPYCCVVCQQADWIAGHSATGCGAKLAAANAAVSALIAANGNGENSGAAEIEKLIRDKYPGYAAAMDLWWSRKKRPGSWSTLMVSQRLMFAIPRQAKDSNKWTIHPIRKHGSSSNDKVVYSAPGTNDEMLMPLLMIKIPKSWSKQEKGSSTTQEAYNGQKLVISGTAKKGTVNVTWGAPFFLDTNEDKDGKQSQIFYGYRAYRLTKGEWILDPKESQEPDTVEGTIVLSNDAGVVLELATNPYFASRGDLINGEALNEAFGLV